MSISHRRSCFFFFNDTATTEIYTLSLHDALPICRCQPRGRGTIVGSSPSSRRRYSRPSAAVCSSVRRTARSEEHTSELQSRQYLVCRLLLEKKKLCYSPSPRSRSRHGSSTA